ncbi:MAG TPA: YfhO family protein, partial [Patescibacteria group bacterium]
MKKFIGLIFLTIILLIFFRGFFFKGLLPIPSDTIIGLYHPFRDLYATDYPRGVPFKNFLITDPVRQQYPWKSLVIEAEKNMQLPLWNPYSFSGYPLLANLQSAAFYPLNVIFFFGNLPLSWSFFIFIEFLLAGFFLYLYLQKMNLHKNAALVGALTFMFCGFSVSWGLWGNVLSTILWLPLIFYVKEVLLKKFSFTWIIIFIFAEVSALFAGHLQIWFYSLLISNAYLFVRICQTIKNKKNNNFIFNFAKKYSPFLIVGLVVFGIGSLQLIPTFQFISLSARDVDQSFWQQPGWFIPWQNIIQFIAPDFFGNPTTLNYWGVWNYAEFVGYVGIVPLVFALFAIIFRNDKKTIFFSIILGFSFIFAFPTFLAKIPYELSLPFISTSQPTRLMAIIDLSLAILAALGVDLFLQKSSRKIFFVIGIIAACFVGLWVVVLKFHVGITIENLHVAKQNLILPTILFGISSILIIFYVFIKNKKIQVILLGILLLLTIGDLLRFADKFIPFTLPQYLFPQDKVLTYLQKNSDNFRIMTTDSRILAPNFSDMYHLQSIDGYDPLYLRRYAEYISASERGNPDIHSPFGFIRIITPQNYSSRLINLLGVKYILSLSDIESPK